MVWKNMEINKIYNEDCLTTLNRMPENYVDFVVTSPPYGGGLKADEKTKETWRTYKGFSWDFEKIAKELYRVLKLGRHLTWVVADVTKNFSESLDSFKQAIYFVEQCGFKLLDTMIYERSGGPPQYPGLLRYPHRFEYIFVLSKGKPSIYNPIKDVKNKYAGTMNKSSTQRQKDGTTKFSGDYLVKEMSIRGNVWRYNTGYNVDTQDKLAFKHPARFPEKLVNDLIVSFSNKDDLVYDPFGGSGTSALMAKILERNFITSEISKEYCEEIIQKRFSERLKLNIGIIK